MQARFYAFLIALWILAIAKGNAQELSQIPFSIKGDRVPLVQIFSQITDATGLEFLYDNNTVDENFIYSFRKYDAKDLRSVLVRVSKQGGLNFQRINNTIVVSANTNSAPTITDKRFVLKGKVNDAEGAPLLGVSVSVRSTTRGTITDLDGEYELFVSPGEILRFSSVGYISAERVVKNQPELNISLSEDVANLNEIIVVGFGQQSRESVTGAVTQIKATGIQDVPTTKSAEALQGRVAGLNVSRSGGSAPGVGANISIRGLVSLTGGPPLYVVDGTVSAEGKGALNNINLEDVESITILKDAASAAIYGARASHGVILITTKSRRVGQGKPRLTYSSSYSVQFPGNIPKPMDSYERAILKNLSRSNASLQAKYSAEELEYFRDPDVDVIIENNEYNYFANTDWYGEFLDNASQTKQSLALDFGGKTGRYRMSVGYGYQSPMFDNKYVKSGQNYQRYNFRINSDHKIGSILDIGTKITYSRRDNVSPSGGWNGLLGNLSYVTSRYPMYNPDGTVGGQKRWSPLSALQTGEAVENRETITLVSDLKLDFDKLLKGLKAKTLVSYARNWVSSRKEAKTVYQYYPDGSPSLISNSPNSLTENRSVRTSLNVNATLEWARNYGGHNIKLMAGSSLEYEKHDKITATGEGFVNQDAMELKLAQGETYVDGSEYSFGLLSWLGRANYDYKKKYLVEGVLRYDGSSRFSPENRWLLFPSLSAGWRISEEPWLRKVAWIDELKAKVSWGRVGNQYGLGYYDYIPVLNSGSDYVFGTDNERAKSVYQSLLYSENRTWEIVESFNTGIETVLFQGRLSIIADIFRRNINGMFMQVDYPSTIGVGVPLTNAGRLYSWGWELSASWRDRIGDVDFGISVVLDDNRNKILKFENKQAFAGNKINIEGYPAYSVFGFQTDGLYQTQEEVDAGPDYHEFTGPGDVRYVDQNEDGKIDEHDVVFLGDTDSHYNFGAGLDLGWKGFQLSAYVQGTGKRLIQAGHDIMLPLTESWYEPFDFQSDYWTEDNRDAKFPRPYQGGAQNKTINESYLWNAAYVRLKSVRLSYDFQRKTLRKLMLQNAQIYISGYDLWHWAPSYIPGIDPEGNGKGFYPPPTTLTLGLRVTI
ncbi:SusC/RagA family TonB-linked outer membrane protein [Fulvitalea axinellae]